MPNITSAGALVLRELCIFAGVALATIHRLTAGGGAADYSPVNSGREVPLAYTAEPFVTRTVSLGSTQNGQKIYWNSHQDGCSYQLSHAPRAGKLKLEAAWLHIWSSYTTPCLPAPPPPIQVWGVGRLLHKGGEERGG